MSVYTIICSLIGRSDSLGREGVQVYVLFLPYMYLLMNLYLAPDKLPLTRTPHIHTPSVIITRKERKGEECFLLDIYLSVSLCSIKKKLCTFYNFTYTLVVCYTVHNNNQPLVCQALSLSNPSASREK